MSLPDWWPDWRGETCIVVASGPSAKDAPLDIAKGRARVIVINESWRLAPWADVLYAGDYRWWKANEGLPEWTGLKVSVHHRLVENAWGIRHLPMNRGDVMETARLGILGWGGNSGFQAVNLAAQLVGPGRVILVGFDMTLASGVHWHGAHPQFNPKPDSIGRWRRVLDRAAASLAKAGTTVLNASPASALRNYPKVSLGEALA